MLKANRLKTESSIRPKGKGVGPCQVSDVTMKAAIIWAEYGLRVAFFGLKILV